MDKQPTPAEIRAAREAAGLTLAASAALVHVNLRTWQKWEAAEDDCKKSVLGIS